MDGWTAGSTTVKADAWSKFGFSTVDEDSNGDGRVDRRLTSHAGALMLIESQPDAAGQLTKRVEVK
jgi:hypothetical protein